MSGGGWVAVGICIPFAAWWLLYASFWVAGHVGNARHRLRVREAIRQGWVEPCMPSNWAVVDNGARLYGVTGVERTPDPGIRISQYAQRAAETQREVEEAWLKGIDRGRVSHENEATEETP